MGWRQMPLKVLTPPATQPSGPAEVAAQPPIVVANSRWRPPEGGPLRGIPHPPSPTPTPLTRVRDVLGPDKGGKAPSPRGAAGCSQRALAGPQGPRGLPSGQSRNTELSGRGLFTQ